MVYDKWAFTFLLAVRPSVRIKKIYIDIPLQLVPARILQLPPGQNTIEIDHICVCDRGFGLGVYRGAGVGYRSNTPGALRAGDTDLYYRGERERETGLQIVVRQIAWLEF